MTQRTGKRRGNGCRRPGAVRSSGHSTQHTAVQCSVQCISRRSALLLCGLTAHCGLRAGQQQWAAAAAATSASGGSRRRRNGMERADATPSTAIRHLQCSAVQCPVCGALPCPLSPAASAFRRNCATDASTTATRFGSPADRQSAAAASRSLITPPSDQPAATATHRSDTPPHSLEWHGSAEWRTPLRTPLR